MSSLVAFNCFAFVPEENEKAFIDLFAHSKDVANAFNFGLMTQCSLNIKMRNTLIMDGIRQNTKI